MYIEERIPEEEDLNKAIGYLVIKNMQLLEEVEQLRGSLDYWQRRCSEAHEDTLKADTRFYEEHRGDKGDPNDA